MEVEKREGERVAESKGEGLRRRGLCMSKGVDLGVWDFRVLSRSCLTH